MGAVCGCFLLNLKHIGYFLYLKFIVLTSTAVKFTLRYICRALLVDISTSMCYTSHLLKLQQFLFVVFYSLRCFMKERFETFTVLINRISRNIRKIKNLEMAQYNLRSPHISCLYYLYSAQGLTATELCERCEEDKATVSRSIEYLEENGYITCTSKNAKRYKTPITLTEKGIEAGEKIAQKINRVLDEVSTGLTEDERAAFYKSLAVISNSLDEVLKEREK